MAVPISPMYERLWNSLTSTWFALILFGILGVFSLLGTLPGFDVIYHQPFFRILLGLLGFCTLACTLRKRKSVAWHVFVIHSGVILTLAGGMFSWLGFVATVNAYEGEVVERFFRWDVESEQPLGFTMTVTRINSEYYPVPVKVGVLRGAEKKDLFILKTGESFNLDQYRVLVDSYDPAASKLLLTVYSQGQAIGTADTEDKASLPENFPFSFKLVAFQNPILKRMWVDLRLAANGQTLLEGTSEVNNPLQWNGLSFFHTQISTDPDGRRYAGIQIVKDPGRPLVFAGLIITSLGGILAFSRRVAKN